MMTITCDGWGCSAAADYRNLRDEPVCRDHYIFELTVYSNYLKENA
jgi:hypothetical protein